MLLAAKEPAGKDLSFWDNTLPMLCAGKASGGHLSARSGKFILSVLFIFAEINRDGVATELQLGEANSGGSQHLF